MKIFSSLFGGGGGSKPAAAPAPAAPAAAKGAGAPAGVAPGTSPDDFKRQQTAYYQQMLSGTGLLPSAGAPLPEGVQSNIDKQAALV